MLWHSSDLWHSSEFTTFLFQIEVVAYDTAYTDQVTTATVPIMVSRNAWAPVFSQPEYSISITENHRLGTSVLQLTATDDDQVRS